MLPIVLCSILSVSLIIEKWRNFRQVKSETEQLKKTLEPLIENNHLQQAATACKNFKGLIPQIFRVVLVKEVERRNKNQGEGTDILRAIHEEMQLNAIPHLERHLNVLDSLSRGTPLLGLLGTVVGMIRMFSVISQTGLGEPDALAKGIGIALITTAAGLTVAIPTFFAHSYFVTRVEEFILEMEKSAVWFQEQFDNRIGE